MALSVVRVPSPQALYGGQFEKVRTATETDQATVEDVVIAVDSTSGAFNLDLPALSESYLPDGAGQRIRIVMVGDGGDVTVREHDDDGAASLATLDDVGDSVELIARSSTAWLLCTDLSTVAADQITESELEVSRSFTLALPFTLGNRSGPGSDGVLIGVITDSAIGDCNTSNTGGTVFADETTDINDAGASDVALAEPFDTDDAIYFGAASIFYALKIMIGTAGAGDSVAGEVLYEYSQGGDVWASLEAAARQLVDDSTSLTAGTSTYLVSFVPPADWATQAVDGGTAMFHVRIRATADDVYNTTTPLLTQAWCKRLSVGDGVTCPMTGSITAVDMSASTASATNDDTELLLVNVTQGTFEQVTWTGADVADRVTGLALAVTAGDKLALICVQEDGTTEFANGQLNCQVDI
jgi:hypothetical protein